MTSTNTRPSKIHDAGEYVSELIGQRWSPKQSCWWLVCKVMRDLAGVDLPMPAAYRDVVGTDRCDDRATLFASHEARSGWTEIEKPCHLSVAMLRHGTAPAGHFIHAGVYLALDAGGVLHTDEPHGVVFDSMLQLAGRRWSPSFFIPRA